MIHRPNGFDFDAVEDKMYNKVLFGTANRILPLIHISTDKWMEMNVDRPVTEDAHTQIDTQVRITLKRYFLGS